jgi:hypothetical protein
MLRPVSRLAVVFLTVALLLNTQGCVAHLHKKTGGFTADPLTAGVFMPFAAAFDLAFLPISVPLNLNYFLNRHAPRPEHPQTYYEAPPVPASSSSSCQQPNCNQCYR